MKAKLILCHLKSTINQSILFKKYQKSLKLEGFYDTDGTNLSDSIKNYDGTRVT